MKYEIVKEVNETLKNLISFRERFIYAFLSLSIATIIVLITKKYGMEKIPFDNLSQGILYITLSISIGGIRLFNLHVIGEKQFEKLVKVFKNNHLKIENEINNFNYDILDKFNSFLRKDAFNFFMQIFVYLLGILIILISMLKIIFFDNGNYVPFIGLLIVLIVFISMNIYYNKKTKYYENKKNKE